MSNIGSTGNNSFSIGKYDEGLFDLADDLKIQKKASSNSKKEAMEIARNNPGAEFVVERNDSQKGLTYDVYSLKINDPGKSIGQIKDVDNVRLFDKALDIIEEKTGNKNSIKANIVAGNGEVSESIYKTQFSNTTYNKIKESVKSLRESMGFEKNAPWFWLVDTVMGSSAPADNLPAIDNKELNNMKSHIKPGDIILNGNDGSFIHGIIYVGKDKELQANLEKEWNLPKGALDNEDIIIHALVSDHDKEIDVNGKKETLKAVGEGVHIDTIDRYIQRSPRDVMLAVSVKDASDTDRQAAINKAKEFVGKKYDRSFDTFDDTEMYCTETVMKAWQGTDNPPKFTTQRNPLISYPQFVLDKLPDKLAKAMQDGGMLHQEMIMTDGIATSPSTELVWASQNADKSVFFEKHQRWDDGIKGKINDGYRKMLLEDVPNVAIRSGELTEKIKELSARTRNEVK